MTKIRSKWVSGLLEFFAAASGATVLKVTETGIEADVKGNVTGNVTGNVAGNAAGYALKSEARTATADGAGTGTISAGVTHVVVTSDDANKIIKLPAPVPGLKLTLINCATGYEIRSSDPANISINGGKAANAESAVAANTVVKLECISATVWIGSTVGSDGTVGVLEVAAA
jgi:hypothetical protein